ncbi:MAG: RNA-binding S4 domain-containing protein [Verrucomicrobia bacterium]|nr:RNA-binding S4 domain-containing protein [Verrucomicrobiota bacterium]
MSNPPPDPALPAERIDLWLWAVRRFKTRALAAAACRKGQVKIGGREVKPSRLVRPGDRIEIEEPFLTVVLEMKAALKQRVGASRVPEFYSDLTSPEAIAVAEGLRAAVRAAPRRDPGLGRPTKRERRELDQLEGGAGRDEG